MNGFSWIKFAGATLLLVAVVFIFLAWTHYHRDKEFIDQSLRVESSVTSFEEFKHYEGAKTEYAPVLTYTRDGQSHEFHSHHYDFNKRYEPGDSVILYLDKNNLEIGLMDSFSVRWLNILLFSGVAFVFLVLAGTMLLIKWH